jgi:uncharacterized protein YndB with AHSA1/START domain
VIIASDRQYRFSAEPAEVWERASQTGRYQQWWPWLQRCDAASLSEGEVWICSVQPPLPYRVNFTVSLHQVRQNVTVEAGIEGDIEGDARLDISPTAEGCTVRLRSHLSPSNRVLKAVAAVARPMVSFGHDWVLDTGARQFQLRALDL